MDRSITGACMCGRVHWRLSEKPLALGMGRFDEALQVFLHRDTDHVPAWAQVADDGMPRHPKRIDTSYAEAMAEAGRTAAARKRLSTASVTGRDGSVA